MTRTYPFGWFFVGAGVSRAASRRG